MGSGGASRKNAIATCPSLKATRQCGEGSWGINESDVFQLSQKPMSIRWWFARADAVGIGCWRIREL